MLQPNKYDHHRPTAYTLWAKDYRANMKATQPHVKTSSYAHRLASLWAEVPNNEKYSWRRRARRAVDQTQEQLKLNEKLSASKLATNNILTNGTTSTNGLLANKSELENSYSNVKFGTLSLDAAAHLKLLGENLNLIGERLKEHEVGLALTFDLISNTYYVIPLFAFRVKSMSLAHYRSCWIAFYVLWDH